MTKKRIVLRFPNDLLEKPVTYHLIRDFDLVVNILKAKITPREEGLLVLAIEGERKNVEAGLEYLKNIGVQTQPLIEDINWDSTRCTHCTACVTVCPTNAFRIDRNTMRVEFDRNKCIACGLCVDICPYHALEIIV